jgi:hypothetical protein
MEITFTLDDQKFTGDIPEPIDIECITAPDQIDSGDRVEIHASGYWRSGTVIGARAGTSGDITVEYMVGERIKRRTLPRSAVVPLECGYPVRSSSDAAEQWAIHVWEELRNYAAGGAPRRAAEDPCLVCGGSGAMAAGSVDPEACDACNGAGQ